ncbi:MAG: radical SAM protein [Nanoarchaeota archaeon]|nr:radical SAM protein [Nanoarchaeota archaeon]MBU1704183.1 radical SAM protein [Nanoarchaeota archaeon]
MKTKKQEFKEKVTIENLLPDPSTPGRFVGHDAGAQDGIGHLSPNSWVFHDQVASKVIEGDYLGIMPFSGEFVTTMNCSNRCSIPCSYEVAKKIEGLWEKNQFSNPIAQMQSLGFAEMLVDRLVEAGVKGLTLTGGGEPFLFTGLEELAHYVTSNGIDLVVYTNGNSVSKSRINRLLEAEPMLVRVSLNAGTKDVYNAFHSPLNPEHALDNSLDTIETLARGSILNPKISVGVGVVINKVNEGDLVEVAYRLRDITEKTGGGIGFVTYRPAFNYFGSEQLKCDILDRTHEIVETEVREALRGTGIKVSNVTSRYLALKQDTRYYNACRASGLFYEVAPSGNLHLCCDRNCHRDYIIGNLSRQSLAEIWQSQQRIDMIHETDSDYCKTCPPACKPHLVNNQFAQIEALRDAGELYKVEVWIESQRAMPKPKMVNF